MSGLVVVEVEQALGPGVEFERDSGAGGAGVAGLVGRRARLGSVWFGFDRAALADSDDGHGRGVPVLVAVPGSTFAGARLEVELTGGWEASWGTLLVARLPGTALPPPALARVVGDIDIGARWLDRDAAARLALQARQRHRERQSHARISGGRAWYAIGALPPELARFATPHSAAEYSLARLPPRFLRGLAGLLDDDERLLYWIERPMVSDAGILRRLRGRIDRRAALLALTDRQLLWIVDHARPDRYLSDWGVDVEVVPIERLLQVRCSEGDDVVELTIVTPAGTRVHALPSELREEVRVMRDLAMRFTPPGAGDLPRRRYSMEPVPFTTEAAARFGQEPEARALHQTATRDGEVLSMLFSPRRPGQRSPAALVLRPGAVELLGADQRRILTLAEVAVISLTLSPLAGRISLEPGIRVSYPAPLADRATAFVRLARRTIATLA